MAERKPYTTKTRQLILEYLKRQQAVTVSVSDIEEDSVCSAAEICFMESARTVKRKKLLRNPDSLVYLPVSHTLRQILRCQNFCKYHSQLACIIVHLVVITAGLQLVHYILEIFLLQISE